MPMPRTRRLSAEKKQKARKGRRERANASGSSRERPEEQAGEALIPFRRWKDTQESKVALSRPVYTGYFCRSNSMQLNATQCNFCPAEVATSCDFIAILVQFVSVNVSTRLSLKQKLCAC